MLIARAVPIMRVYIKPGGQRGYSGHCINLPQNVTELATTLPRYPKDLAVIIVKVKGRENTFKDVTVRKQKVQNALVWLINNNPHYSEILINEGALNLLPENGVPPDLMTVETDDDIVSDENSAPDVGPPTDNPSEDIVYNNSTEMSSFLPVGEQQQQEIEAVRNQLSENEPMEWPSVENEPLNEYQISHLATMAFPTLFPDGKGDPTNQGLLRDVPLQERIKHLLKFAEIIDGKWVYRFANHPRFSYWAFNMIQRKRILQQSGIFLKQNPGEAHLTIDELREMAASNNANVFISKVSRYVGNIAGTNAYWNKVREELKAIITSVGAPTLFFTFSSADMHWPELHALFKADANSNINNSTSDVRRQNVINNPHIVDWFFTQRYEYQGRGSIHCHGTAKLNNDPGLCQLTRTALKGFLAQKLKDENDSLDTTELDQDIEAGQKAADTVCQYVDWLLSTVNPNPPDEDMWIRPEVHPCQRSHDIPEHEKQSDYVDLLNMVQRHTRCSASYCLRKKSSETELKCRFHFPFDYCSQTKLEFEKIHTSGDNEHYRAKIVTKRNDSRLNNHQHLQLQGWRANCDIQVVIDHYACVEYFTKYAAKGEPRSPILKQAFNSIMQNVDSNTDPRRAIKKIVMKSLGERDYAAQETMHHLLSLKLHSSSFKVMPVSLNGSGKSLILTGDPGQLPPVADKPLYHAKPSNAVGEQGHQAYHMFDKVVKLTVNQRVQGMTSEQVQFRDLSLRLRKGDSTVDDWKLLLTRQPSNVTNLCDFEDSTRLFYSNEQVGNYNHEQLTKLEHPIAHINARHSSALAKKISSDDMSGLEPVVFLAKGARVMLTMNLWSCVGLCNGATGTIVDIIYQNNHQPPDLPIAVIVEFENYRGPVFNESQPLCIPIYPITVTSQTEIGFHERQQLPLRLAWALTIHKSQGLTLSKAWIDIGKSERTAGVSYVAISRVKSLASCVIEPMTYERLTSLKSSANLQYRLEEENRLDQLAQTTNSSAFT
ncbi:Hypothetical predicted protein [Paramuricea clavata]|uniref:Uncharacterized protein n=1 Tax=Paramuricea clavata TaxID=317549 RepID=A0A6S7IT25_PARCT|nr:Hypothetical predicted protein [Paramuricea clavata]